MSAMRYAYLSYHIDPFELTCGRDVTGAALE